MVAYSVIRISPGPPEATCHSLPPASSITDLIWGSVFLVCGEQGDHEDVWRKETFHHISHFGSP